MQKKKLSLDFQNLGFGLRVGGRERKHVILTHADIL